MILRRKSEDPAVRHRTATAKSWWPVAAVAAIGLVASGLAFRLVSGADERHVRAALELRAEWRARDFQRKIELAAGPVIAAAAFVASQPSLEAGSKEAEEFERFAAHAGQGIAAIRSIGWAPRVTREQRAGFERKLRDADLPNPEIFELNAARQAIPAAERAEYFPLLVHAAFEGQKPPAGFDLASEPVRRHAIERARDSGRPSGSQPVQLIVLSRTELSYLILVPIYEGGRVPATIAERRRLLSGFAYGTFRLFPMLEAAIEGTPELAGAIAFDLGTIADDDAAGDPTSPLLPVAVYSPARRQIAAAFSSDDAVSASAYRLEKSFDVIGQRWRLEFTFPPDLVAQERTSGPLIALLAGILLTSALSVYLARERGRRASIERVVDAQTAELRQKGAVLSTLIERLPIAVSLIGPDLRFMAFNKRFLDGYGLAADTVAVGDSYEKFLRSLDAVGALGPGKGETAIEERLAVARNPKLDQFDINLPDGRAFDVRLTPLPGGGLVTTRMEITERIGAEQRIKRERDTAQGYLDVAGVMILALDRDGTVTLINRQGCALLGYDHPGDIVGKSWVDTFIPERLRDEMRAAFRRLCSGEEGYLKPQVNLVVTRSGEERLIAWHNALLTDELGRVLGTLSSGDDITDRRRREVELEEARQALEAQAAELKQVNFDLRREVGKREEASSMLEAANAKLQALVDASPLPIVSLDTRRRVVTWNQAAERTFGYSAAEIMGRHYPLVPPEGEAEFDAFFQRSKAGEHLRDVAVKRRHKDGRSLDVIFSGSPLLNADGRLIGVVYVLEDVTEKRKLEQQIAQAVKMDAVGQLTGGIAHDFNNILGIVVGNLDQQIEMLGSRREIGTIAGEAKDLGTEALNAALRGAELVKRLLAFSRSQPLQPRLLDLTEVVREVEPLLWRALGENITIETRVRDRLWPVKADPTELENVLLNLAINARDAMPGGGSLTLACANTTIDEAESLSELPPGDYVALSVADTGSGIPPEVLAKVFEPFFTTKEVGKGSGLGLSMVYGYARQSGGTVKIYSEVGHGTEVRVYLPRAAGVAEEVVAAVDNAPAEPGSERILVVEDKAEVRAMAVRLLSSLGYQVVDADSAASALKVIDGGATFDLLFTDIIMPGTMSGIDLAREVRRRFPRLPIVFTSGFSNPEMVHAEATAMGATLISKPYRKTALAGHLRTVFEQSLSAS